MIGFGRAGEGRERQPSAESRLSRGPGERGERNLQDMPERSGTSSARTDRPGISLAVLMSPGATRSIQSQRLSGRPRRKSQSPQSSAGLPIVFSYSQFSRMVPRNMSPTLSKQTANMDRHDHLRPLPLPSAVSMNATRQEEHARFRLSLRKRCPIQGTERDAVDFLLGRTYPGAKMRIPFLPTSGPHIPWVIAERQTQ